MISTFFVFLTTSYIAWYIQNHEHAAIYPFDTTYSTPAEAGAPQLSETVVTTEDGETLIVWQTPVRQDAATILYLSGNAGTLSDRAERFGAILREGYGLTAPAYRGSSGSTGSPDERTLVRDAEMIAASIDGPLILYGESLGAAVAVQLAARGIGDVVILEAPFTSAAALVAAQYPMEDLDAVITQRWDSLGIVSRVTQPLFILHGDADQFVPIEMGRSIHDAAGSAVKEINIVMHADHAGLWTMETRRSVFQFIEDNS